MAVEYTCTNQKTQESSYRLDYPGNAYLSVTKIIVLEPHRINYIMDWLLPESGISFLGTQKLSVRADGNCLPFCHHPFEEFGELWSLKLEGEADLLIPLVGSDYAEDSESVLFPNLLEVQIAPGPSRFNFNRLKEALKERVRAGYRVKTLHISTGRPNERTSKDLEELKEVVESVIIM